MQEKTSGRAKTDAPSVAVTETERAPRAAMPDAADTRGSASNTDTPSKPCQKKHGADLPRFKEAPPQKSRLSQWPCQIELIPPGAPYLEGAHLLIAADCTAFAYGNFHEEFMKGRITLTGCTRTKGEDYIQKLSRIIGESGVEAVTVVKMEVPCCEEMENTVRRAIAECNKPVPLKVITVSTDGKILCQNK